MESDAKAAGSQAAPPFKYCRTEDIRPGDLILEEELWLWNFLSPDCARRACNYCFTPASTNNASEDSPCLILRTCSGCKGAFYCSKNCQVSDWKCRHKFECSMLKQSFVDPGKFLYKDSRAGESRVRPAYTEIRRTSYVNVLLAMTSKVLVAASEHSNNRESSGIVKAYLRMPKVAIDNKTIRDASFVKELYSVATQKGIADGQIDVSKMLQRIQPALVTLIFSPSVCSPLMNKIFGLGLCLEMSRFGSHSCYPNAIVIPGDGRKVRVIATAHVASLDAVRLGRDSSCLLAEMNQMERQLHLRACFGYLCNCTRCRLSDANDPFRDLMLRCPNVDCEGSCKCSGNLKVSAVANTAYRGSGAFTGTTVERAAKAMFAAKLGENLQPCSVCVSKYSDHCELAENLYSLNRCTIADTSVATLPKCDDEDKMYAAKKRYLHPLSLQYQHFGEKHLLAVLKLVIAASSSENFDDVKEENSKYGSDILFYLQTRLDELNRILEESDENKSDELPQLFDLAFWAMSLKVYALLCIGQSQNSRHADLFDQLALVSEQLREKAEMLLSRIITPKQLLHALPK